MSVPSLRPRRLAVAAAGLAAVAGVGVLPFATRADAGTPDLARTSLAARDGWASSGSGTTGGQAADAAHDTTVTTRAELVKALRAGPSGAPRIIRIRGRIDANTDDQGRRLGCDDYAKGTGYTLAAYLKAYDPAVWGRSKLPAGAQESARAAAQARQAERIAIAVPSNTTIVGVPGTDAGINGGSLLVQKADNVIIRNLTFADTRDCFPQWDPTDGSDGNWNSAYDAVTLRGATHAWIDHNTFTDRPNFDSGNPRHFGRAYQVHDGALDITNASDLVTVSYNRFTDHDKTMLIGSSDKDTKLRVTLHHNVFQGIVQRAPLARAGQVHLYNNHFDTTARNGYAHHYSVNARAGVQIVAQHNHWTLSSDRKASQLLSGDGTGSFAGSGNMVNGTVTDLVAAHNAANKKKIKAEAAWRPALSRGLEASAAGLPASLARTAGAGVLK
ncbi:MULTISPECIES: polysaccharide lyase family 1 protein [Streptomyces]|uniref:pectate lyase family protein n=1 Tax=Streptomyces TaxID=1883 RepID=UPI0016739AC1|nr:MULTISPECIES: polysaccharide lyase family 1 protein [Streptomyces]MBD3577612.1 polysaccharide lyase family 1 protein [Streptomyces sp. KD18]GGT09539.1 pectate lyase [Streptomyces toxytricini]